jgi:hypothetical protein
MGFRDFILQVISKLPPLVKIDIASLTIGGRQYRVEKGNIIFDVGGTESAIPLRRDQDGLYRPIIDGVVVEGLSQKKKRMSEALIPMGRFSHAPTSEVRRLSF